MAKTNIFGRFFGRNRFRMVQNVFENENLDFKKNPVVTWHSHFFEKIGSQAGLYKIFKVRVSEFKSPTFDISKIVILQFAGRHHRKNYYHHQPMELLGDSFLNFWFQWLKTLRSCSDIKITRTLLRRQRFREVIFVFWLLGLGQCKIIQTL